MLCCFWSSKIFCSPSFGASYVTKIVQINKGMNMICLFQVKGVTGMMWVGTYDQFAFYNLRSLEVIILSLHFKKVFKIFRWCTQCKTIHLNQWRNEQDISFPSEGGHRHDVGWHIWPICILELKIFGCHSIVFALQKKIVKI